MRSAAMRCSTSSRSNRLCRRTVAPASAAARRLSRPRMCDGGVATWNRSSGPSPRASTPVGGGGPDRGVRVAHRLGQPGGPRAEHEDRLVVGADVQGGRGAPAGGPGRGRGHRGRRGRSPPSVPRAATSTAAPGSSATARRAPVSSRACATSTAFHAGLSSTAAAPRRLMAFTATTNSTRLVSITATRSPRPTPSSARWRPKALANPSSASKDHRSSPASTASRAHRTGPPHVQGRGAGGRPLQNIVLV